MMKAFFFFIGDGGIGVLKLQDYCQGGVSSGVTVVFADCEDTQPFIQFSGGYHFNNAIAGEAGFGYARGFDYTADFSESGTTVTGTGDTNFRTFSAGLRARLAFNEKISVVGRAGVHAWKSKVSIAFPDGFGGTVSDDGTDPYFGIQLEYVTAGNSFIGVSATRYEAGDSDADAFGIYLRRPF